MSQLRLNKGKGLLFAATIFALLLLPTYTDTGLDTSSGYQIAPVNNNALSAYTALNVSQLWQDIFDETSLFNVGNYTQNISESFANRTWVMSNMSPSLSLQAAWEWANDTLQDNTGGDLSFETITEYQSLIALKEGIDPTPRPAIVITGMIDSDLTPGANEAGVSTAAVLELARVLHNYTLSIDIYYVLINGAHSDPDYDLGSRAFVAWLDENEIETVNVFSINRLLFHRADYIYGTRISMRVSDEMDLYQDSNFIPDLMISISNTFGTGRFQKVIDLGLAEQSSAYEMWQTGRPAIHISQGYYPDSRSGTNDDVWDYPDFSMVKATEAIATMACAIAYIASLGEDPKVAYYSNLTLHPTDTTSQYVIISCEGYVNVTITWPGNATLNAEIADVESAETVYQRTEDDGLIVMKYLAHEFGNYKVTLTNLGPNSTAVLFNITLINDVDGDTLSDTTELNLGTNVYLRDSDRDGLNDDFELVVGSDPTILDSDQDGASDSQEYLWGSSLTNNDTDSDGISDGTEAELGTNPTLEDTDADGIGDYDEVYVYLTNPTSFDTDLDGLEDGFEISMGLNPLSPDSDGDTLSDLFEVLNQLNPLSRDTDSDGWSDAYEVEYCMSPTDADTDSDGIPDGIDWDPQEHWISMVAPITLLTIVILLGIFSTMKLNLYKRE